MSDRTLRELEREALDGTSEAALRYARALERAGRGDEAVRALRAHADQAEVRRALDAYPAWVLERGPGNTQALDTPPITSPRVCWTYVPPKKAPGLGLLATPYAVASRVGDLGTVLDGERGQVRWTTTTPLRQPWVLFGDTLVSKHKRELVAQDVWTGARRWTLPAHASAMLSMAGPLLLVSSPGEVTAHRAGESSLAPRVEWRTVHGDPTTFVTGSDALVAVHGVVLLDALTGERRLELPPGDLMSVDALGVVVRERGLETLGLARAHTPGGQIDLHDGPFLACGATHVPFASRQGLVVAERSTGKLLSLDLAHLEPHGALARSTCYLLERTAPGEWTLAAVEVDGRLAWRLRLPLPRAQWSVDSLAVSPSRLHLLTGRGVVMTIESV